jgi:hypothetical protein
VAKVVSALRNKNVKESLIKPVGEKTNASKATQKVDNIASALINYIEGRVNPFDSQITSIVTDFVNNGDYINMYYTKLIVNN